jgi:hypothetical protein
MGRPVGAKSKKVKRQYKMNVDGVAEMIWDLIEQTRAGMLKIWYDSEGNERKEINEAEGLRIISMYTAQLQKLYAFNTTTAQKGEIERKLTQVLDLIDGKGIEKVTSVKNQVPAVKFSKHITPDEIIIETDE